MVDAKPEWVPEWVWVEYLDLRDWETPRHDGDDYLPRMYRRMDAIVVSPGCAPFWRAIGHRKDKLEKRDRAMMGLGAGFRVFGLLLEIAENAEGVPHKEALSAADRRKLGGAIAKRARDLRDTLADMARGRDQNPAAFNDALNEFAEHFPKGYKPQKGLRGTFALAGIKMSPEMAAVCVAGYRDAVTDLAFEGIGGLLDALERAGTALADSIPPVAHLASPEAARLHFVRMTTLDMRFHFGQPLREAVAALANVLFPAGPNGGLDAATVAKLAP